MNYFMGTLKESQTYKKSTKLYNKAQNINEDTRIDNLIKTEERADARTDAISRLSEQAGMSRSKSVRRTNMDRTQYRNELKEKLFMESVYDMFMEAMPLDNSFKEKYAGNFYNLAETTIQNLFQSGQVSYKTIMNEGSEIIKTVLELCEDVAEKESVKAFPKENGSKKSTILNEKDKKPKGIDAEAKGDFDDKKAVETKTVAEAVKEKVVKVVRDEQETAEKEQAIQEEIESMTATQEEQMDSGEVDAKAIKQESVKFIKRSNKLTEHSLFKSLQLNIASKNLKELKQISESTEVEGAREEVNLNMDLVFAESLAYYTLLETLYTTRIVNFNANEMRKFSKELVFK